MKAVDAVGPVDCAADVVIAGAVAAPVLEKGRRDYSANGSCSPKSTVAAANVGLVVLEVVIVLGMDRPSDCSLQISVLQLPEQKGGWPRCWAPMAAVVGCYSRSAQLLPEKTMVVAFVMADEATAVEVW